MKSDYSETKPLKEGVHKRNLQEDKPNKRKIRSESPPVLRPNRKKPWKTINLTFFLLFAGILFSAIGIEETPIKGIGETYPLFILGVLLLIPGVYHAVIIICIWCGVSGFGYEMLPQTD